MSGAHPAVLIGIYLPLCPPDVGACLPRFSSLGLRRNAGQEPTAPGHRPTMRQNLAPQAVFQRVGALSGEEPARQLGRSVPADAEQGARYLPVSPPGARSSTSPMRRVGAAGGDRARGEAGHRARGAAHAPWKSRARVLSMGSTPTGPVAGRAVHKMTVLLRSPVDRFGGGPYNPPHR